MGAVAYTNAVLADSPKAFWPCQESSGSIVDVIAGFDLSTITGTPDYAQPGPMNTSSIRCLGGETVSRAGPVSTVTNNFAMELFIHLQTVSGTNQSLFYNGNSGANGWGIITQGTVAGRSWRFLAGGVALGGNSSVQLPNQFAHVVCQRDAGTWEYYVDGVAAGTAGAAAPGAASGGTTSLNSNNSAQAAYAYVAVYESALSQAQITAHFAASQASDPSVDVLSMQQHIMGHNFW